MGFLADGTPTIASCISARDLNSTTSPEQHSHLLQHIKHFMENAVYGDPPTPASLPSSSPYQTPPVSLLEFATKTQD